MKLLGFSWCLLLTLLVWPGSAAAAAPFTSLARDALYDRTTNFFPEVALYKPAESDPPSPFFSFAPLILQELRTNCDAAIPTRSFGAVFITNGVARVDSARPTVYAAMENVEFREGVTQPAFTYVWCYPEPAVGTEAPLAGQLQGLRVALDADGRPALWQVLGDTSRARLLFVSQSLENAAAARYGKPLEGRRYAIERSVIEAPNVVVARMLDDGPVPMGPIVYLNADEHDVTTVICRCMPAQAKRVAEARTYELLPLSDHELLLAAVRDHMKFQPALWLGRPGTRLSEILRLP